MNYENVHETKKNLSFNLQNEEDFIENSKKIEDAIIKILKTPNLKASKTGLSRLTKLHRNTFSKRAWHLTQKISCKSLLKPEGVYVTFQELWDEVKSIKKAKFMIGKNLTVEAENTKNAAKPDGRDDTQEKLNRAVWENSLLFSALQEAHSTIDDYKAAMSEHQDITVLKNEILHLREQNRKLSEQNDHLRNARKTNLSPVK